MRTARARLRPAAARRLALCYRHEEPLQLGGDHRPGESRLVLGEGCRGERPVRSPIVQQVEDQVSVVVGLSRQRQKLAADTVVDGRRHPSTWVAIEGTPNAAASVNTWPNGSNRVGRRKTCASRYCCRSASNSPRTLLRRGPCRRTGRRAPCRQGVASPQCPAGWEPEPVQHRGSLDRDIGPLSLPAPAAEQQSALALGPGLDHRLHLCGTVLDLEIRAGGQHAHLVRAHPVVLGRALRRPVR